LVVMAPHWMQRRLLIGTCIRKNEHVKILEGALTRPFLCVEPPHPATQLRP